MISLAAAFQFLTSIPPLVRRGFAARELGRAVGWFPLVGLAIGGILIGLKIGLGGIFPVSIMAVLLLASWLLLTRALHFDGFLDSCDGLFGAFTPERRLEIMRDSRVGAFAIAGGGLLLLSKYAALTEIQYLNGLLLAPVLGRWACALAIFAFPYARQQGMGRDMKDEVGWAQVLLATLIAGAATWAFAGQWGLLALLAAGALTWLLGRFMLRRIPGLTGDSYGAIVEIVELAALLMFVAGGAA